MRSFLNINSIDKPIVHNDLIKIYYDQATINIVFCSAYQRISQALASIPDALDKSEQILSCKKIKLDLYRINIDDSHIRELIELLSKLTQYQTHNPNLGFALIFRFNERLSKKGIHQLMEALDQFPENLYVELNDIKLIDNNLLEIIADKLKVRNGVKKGFRINLDPTAFNFPNLESGLQSLAAGLQCGNAPDGFGINLLCRNFTSLASITAIANVIATGKAPTNFELSLSFDPAKLVDHSNMLTVFAKAIGSGHAPEGFSLTLQCASVDISLKSYQSFIKSICKAPKSCSIYFNGYKLQARDYVGPICDLLSSGNTPENLYLSVGNRQLGDQSLVQITSAIKTGVKKGNKLKGLTIVLRGNDKNPITDTGLQSVIKLIEEDKIPRDFTINLTGNQISRKGAKALITALESQCHQSGLNPFNIILKDNCLPKKPHEPFEEDTFVDDYILQKINTLLNFIRIQQAAYACMLLLRLIKEHVSQFPEDIACQIFSYVLFSIDQSKNSKDAVCFTKNVVRKNKLLTDLRLCCQVLASGGTQENLRIRLAGVKISDAQLKQLICAIKIGVKTGHKLKGLHLDLRNNLITDDGFAAILALLSNKNEHVPYLCSIDLRGNQITNRSADAYLTALKAHGHYNNFEISLEGMISKVKFNEILVLVDESRRTNQARLACYAFNRAIFNDSNPLISLPAEILLNIYSYVYPFPERKSKAGVLVSGLFAEKVMKIGTKYNKTHHHHSPSIFSLILKR